MEEKINVFDIELNLLTAKKAMRQVMRYMGGESVSTIELIPMEVLLKGQDDAEWKQRRGDGSECNTGFGE